MKLVKVIFENEVYKNLESFHIFYKSFIIGIIFNNSSQHISFHVYSVGLTTHKYDYNNLKEIHFNFLENIDKNFNNSDLDDTTKRFYYEIIKREYENL